MRTKHTAKKKFGQNFLIDQSIIHTIIESMPNTQYRIVEIGPGLGDLTKHLVDVRSVKAFEVDTDLCKHLNTFFHHEITTGKLEIECGDILEHWKGTLLDEPYDLVANLPYYIATAIILKALEDPQCKNMLVMVQREVALKIAAECETKDFGSISVLVQSIADTDIVVDVPPECFDPPPKVHSSVVKITKNASRNDDAFEAFLKVAFTQPRKTLLKNLSAAYAKEKVIEAMLDRGLQESIRPHQTSIEEYHQLHILLNKRSLDGSNKSKSAGRGSAAN